MSYHRLSLGRISPGSGVGTPCWVQIGSEVGFRGTVSSFIHENGAKRPPTKVSVKTTLGMMECDYEDVFNLEYVIQEEP